MLSSPYGDLSDRMFSPFREIEKKWAQSDLPAEKKDFGLLSRAQRARMRERTLAVLILFLVGRGGAYSFDDDLCTTSWICSPESVVVNEDGALVISSDATLRSVPKYETAVRVTGEIERNGCEDHLVIVSTSPSLEWAFDFIPDTIFATWQCDELYLVGSDGFDGVICESSGLTAIELDVGEESSTFRATWEGGNCSLSIAQGLAKESFVSFGARPINVSFALWNSIEIDGVEAAATPTSAPTCTRVDTDERSFSLVGGSYPEQNGLYVLDQSSVCGCRPVYECITCEKEDVSISFDEGLQYWTAASGGCGGFSSDNENPLVAPDALADSPFEIGSFWFEPDALSGEYFSNATLEVSYSIDILGKALSEDNQVLWFGRYDRRGLCADRPYFVGGDERFMYYVESFELWVIGGIGCGDTTTIGLYASSTAPSPLSVAGDVWFEALDEFVENPSISVAFVDFAPSAQPTTLAPSISPAPTTSPAPSTAAPTPAPAESIGFSSVDGCAQDGWTLCENEDIRSEEPLFRQRMVRAKGRIVKDRVCDNHRLFFTESPEETYARLINLEETIQIGWDCDTLFILGPTQTSFSACPQDTYDVEVVVDNAFTTINATGLFAECFVQIDEGLDDTTQDVGELLYAYIGASDGAAWTWISITEEIDEENATPFPTPLLVAPTDPPEPAAVSFANITCGFEEEEKSGLCDAWISGAPGVLGWRFSTDVDTTTPDTGPTSPFSGTVYAYVEASYAFPEVGPFVLESHPLLIRDDEAAILSFRYHMFGEHVGNLSLQVLDSTTIWMSVWSRVGSQGEDWLEGEIEVPATSEQIRFVAYTEFGELGDIALDEIVASYAEIVPTSAPSLSPMPTVTSSPTTSFVPTTAPTALPVVATRTDIEDQILMGEAMVWIESSAIVDFSDGLVFVSESDVAIGTQPSGQTAILDGGGASRIFGVFDVSLSLRDLILRNGYSDNLGGLLVASSASSLDIYRCILESGVALVGGALFAQDNSVVTVYNTTFSNSTALSSGGAIFVRNSASLAMENCVVADNEALEPGEDDEGGGGGIGVENGAFLSLVQVQLLRNTVNGSAGAILIDQQSTVDVTGGSFENNTATLAGGAMLVTKSSTLRLSDTLFLGNIAENRGGAIMVQASSSVVAEETQFLMNIANNVGGGAVQAITSGSFTAKSSTFRENQAPRGGAIEIDSSGVVTLFESTFAENFAEDSDSNWINCAYRGTVYSAKVNIDDLQTFSAVNCAGYLYQFNNDGSPEFLNRTIGNIVREQGSVDITHYTYPCDAGKFSSDGLEHGNAIVDVNGLSINENDPDCIPGCTNEACQCAESCEVCPAGTYLPFSLDKFRSTNIESCVECPVGRFLSDDAQDPLRHDSLEDCEFCPPGRYTDITGSSECFECKASTFSSTNGSTFCETSAGGFFVNEAGASKSLPCPEGRFSVGGAKECSQCTPGSFQSDSAQTVCTVVSPGYFAFDEGAVDEAPCPAGSVSGSGASECSPCDVGRFQRLAGQTECFLSSPGTFVNETGSTSSYNCPAGRYAPSANQSSCDVRHPFFISIALFRRVSLAGLSDRNVL